MNKKERNGGMLTNKEVEEELKKQNKEESQGYRGSQDTGDEAVRAKGTATQQEDGAAKPDS